MAHFLLLHGTGATPESNWFMWLKGVLIGQGHRVWLPQLPGADKPSAAIYTDFILANKDFRFDKDTILIGHSSGAVELLHLLQHLEDDTRVKAAILVGAFNDNLGWDVLNGLFEEQLDFEKIKIHCEQIIFVHSDNDPHCPLEQAEFLAKKTDGRLVVIEGQGHFNLEASQDYRRFPALLELIQELNP